MLPSLNASVALAVVLMLRAAAIHTAPPPHDPDRPITHLFQNLAGDLSRLPSLDTAIVAGAGGLAAAIAHNNADQRLDNWVLNRGDASYTAFLQSIGNGWTQGGGALGTWIVGAVWDRPFVEHLGSDLIRAQVLNAVLTQVIKVAADRPRPSGGRHAFPSGHTSASFASAAVLDAHFGWRVSVPAYSVAALVGWSRIRDREHWLSDVLFGGAVGLIAGRTVTAGHDRRWIVVPAGTPGGGAVFVVLLPSRF